MGKMKEIEDQYHEDYSTVNKMGKMQLSVRNLYHVCQQYRVSMKCAKYLLHASDTSESLSYTCAVVDVRRLSKQAK